MLCYKMFLFSKPVHGRTPSAVSVQSQDVTQRATKAEKLLHIQMLLSFAWRLLLQQLFVRSEGLPRVGLEVGSCAQLSTDDLLPQVREVLLNGGL